MNWSIYTADRTTHLKIVVVGLLAATLIAGFGIAMTAIHPGTDIFAAQAPTVYAPASTMTATMPEKSIVR